MTEQTIQEFVITFGVQYRMPSEFLRDDERHPMGMYSEGYAVVEAPTRDQAREIAQAAFQGKWSFDYDLEEFLQNPRVREWHPDGEILRIAWQTPEKRRIAELGQSVFELMSGRPWNADTFEEISALANSLGMPFEDIDETEEKN